jgi:A/G-specific adenine glycosylase
MPGMMELPPLPLESIVGREPVLRLRHSITNTNYYVQVYAESALGVQPEPREEQEGEPVQKQTAGSTGLHLVTEDAWEDEIFVAGPSDLPQETPLMDELPISADRDWVPVGRLQHLPLTGLARKTLQRLGVMTMPTVQIG